VSQTEVIDELLVGASFFKGGQILAVQVFNQCLFNRCHIVGRLHNRRNRGQASLLGRSPTPLTGNQLIRTVRQLPNQKGLQNADLTN
jgi:hypothetical protein